MREWKYVQGCKNVVTSLRAWWPSYCTARVSMMLRSRRIGEAGSDAGSTRPLGQVCMMSMMLSIKSLSQSCSCTGKQGIFNATDALPRRLLLYQCLLHMPNLKLKFHETVAVQFAGCRWAMCSEHYDAFSQLQSCKQVTLYDQHGRPMLHLQTISSCTKTDAAPLSD